MRTIGMIGGMSWESSAIYYRILNEAVKERLGGHHSAQTVKYSVDFAPIKHLQHEGRWEETAASLAEAARKVEQGGADFVVLCTNTMRRMADAITEAVSMPLVHIADATAEEVKPRASRGWASWPRGSRWSRTSTREDSPGSMVSRSSCRMRRRGEPSTT